MVLIEAEDGFRPRAGIHGTEEQAVAAAKRIVNRHQGEVRAHIVPVFQLLMILNHSMRPSTVIEY